jgi:FHA domain-containing protein
VSGPAAGTRLDVGEGGLEIGRDGRLSEDRELSRRHARVSRLDDGGLIIEDLGSTNGTRINDREISGPTLIGADDTVELGQTKLRLAVPAAEPAAKPAAPGVHGGVHRVPDDLLSVLAARAPVDREWIIKTFFTALPITFAVNFFIRTIAVEYFNVSDDIVVLQPQVLVMISLMPTLGDSIGFYKSFGRPAGHTTTRYLIPTFAVTGVFMTIELILLPASAGIEEYICTVIVAAVAPTVVVPMLLALRVRARLRAEQEYGVAGSTIGGP